MRPVVLWNPRQSTASDDAGTTIIKSVLPPANVLGPYEVESSPSTFHYIPSLPYFAIKRLIEYPDQIDVGCARIHYQPPSSSSEYDVLRALMPGFNNSQSDFSLKKVDPRLWAVIVQIFTNLPVNLRVYPIPLSDKHIPLLQRISPTPDFCLITVLEIPGCKELTDDNVLELKGLHGLCALDASATMLSGFGMKSLSNTLLRGLKDERKAQEKRGPWRLRILRLRNCKKVDNTVFSALSTFPLLSVVDLRGTNCIPNASVTQGYLPGSKQEFYFPTPICTSLAFLSSYCSSLFSSPEQFTLHITSLQHAPQPCPSARFPPTLAMQDVYAVFTPRNGSSLATTVRAEPGNVKSALSYIGSRVPARSQINIGNSHTLARQVEWRQKEGTRARISEAYRERMKRLGNNGREDQYHYDDGHYYEMDWENGGDGSENAVGQDSQESVEDKVEDGDEEEGDGDWDESEDEFEDITPYIDEDELMGETCSLNHFSHSSCLDLNTSAIKPSTTDPEIKPREVPVSRSGFNFSVSVTASQFDPPFAKPPHGSQSIVVTNAEASNFSTNHRDVAVSSDPTTTSSMTEGQALTISRETLSHQQDQLCNAVSKRAVRTSEERASSIPERVTNNRCRSNGASNHARETTPSGVLSTGSGDSHNLRGIAVISGTKRRRLDQPPERVVNASFVQESRDSRAGGNSWPSWDGWDSADRDSQRSHGSTYPISNGHSADINPLRLSPTRDSTGVIVSNSSPPKSTYRSLTTISRILPSPSTSSIPPDLQNSIAAALTSEHNSREAALAFYRPLSDLDRQRAQARATQREIVRVQTHDERLMLYKEPPAWNTLETWNPIDSDKMESKCHAPDVAVLNRTCMKGREGIQALAQVIDQKRRVPTAAPIRPANSTPVTVSKNPFRRKSEPGPRQSLEQSNKGNLNTSTHAALVLDPVKPLVPISILSAPSLPKELRNRTKTETASHPSLKCYRDFKQSTFDRNQQSLWNESAKDSEFYLKTPKAKLLSQKKDHSANTQMLKKSSSNQEALEDMSGIRKSINVTQLNTKVPLPKSSNKNIKLFNWKDWAKK